MTYSEQLEREAGQTRAQVENTLEELRARMTPGQVVDQLVDYARDGGTGRFFRNLGRRTVENPLPVAVIGAGLAWLMFANGRSHSGSIAYRGEAEHYRDRTLGAASHAAEGIGDRASSVAGDVSGAVRSAADSVSETARSASAAVGDMARRAKSSIGDGAHSTTSSLGERASSASGSATSGIRRAAASIGSSASHAGHDAARTTRSVVEFCRDQPLVVAGLGLAIGAAIGAAFPVSEAEERLMGGKDTGNDAKERLAHMGESTSRMAGQSPQPPMDGGDREQPRAAI